MRGETSYVIRIRGHTYWLFDPKEKVIHWANSASVPDLKGTRVGEKIILTLDDRVIPTHVYNPQIVDDPVVKAKLRVLDNPRPGY